MVNWIGLVIPVAYLSVLVGSLATFSSLYRRRKAAKSASLEPWFPPHLERNIYLSLLHLEPQPGQEKPTPVPDSVLKAALLQRACEDIKRILAIRNAKPALNQLLQRGSVGDDLWQRFLRAEKEVEAEIRDVVEEANALSPNWGQVIFQSANEMVHNITTRDKVAEIQAKGKVDRERWEQERARTQASFMKELEADSTASNTTAAAADKEREKANAGSDEDAVLVEADGPGTPASGVGLGSAPGSKGGGGGGTKKKKGKK